MSRNSAALARRAEAALILAVLAVWASCRTPAPGAREPRPAAVRERDPREGATPLHLAAGAGSYELCSLLVERGAALSPADGEGNTPLHLAAAGGSFEVCEYLLARGAPLKARNLKGQIPRDLALQKGREKIALLLKEKP